ncbi:acetyltransferase [Leptomonas pyrrhocoris]|uniref:Acetyltransferase n=1 Tax=Leptomonas pyrrhocoris TaxID=157538 RepID=A0A0N0DZ49_LEPPY|nr:acetyltransferase [Leptomonas pyrrhocoris]KPA84782.1 acetyltransferase [Leptomonas pyrrhocoris]|eukprot:XP_015663221.1 acetyltransferase [Leptomonas pyrrhocoris]
MLRRILFGSGSGAGSGSAATLAGLKYELVTEAKSLEPTISSMLRETEKRQGLLDLPPYNKREFGMRAKTKDGKLAGAVYGHTKYNEAHVALLGANPECRVHGAGSMLLKEFEILARTKYDCNRLALETFSWQARPFYEKVGFEVFGVQKNQPKGHDKYFMEKVWPAEKNSEPVTCYTNATSELVVEDWAADAAMNQVLVWLNEDALRRNIGVPSYDMVPYGLQVKDADGALVACCLYETWWNELHLDKLVVVPEKQRKGIGSAVLKRLEEVAREKKLQQMIADAMSWQAHSFYEKHGFKVFATQKDLPKGHSQLRLLRVLE